MGYLISKLYDVFDAFRENPAMVVMVGLDGAGKTTTIYKLKLDEVVSTIPTLGFNVETVSPCKGLTLTVWDIGGQEVIRPLWRHYYNNADGVIYVIDSNDVPRMDVARDELYGVLESHELENVPLLILANKQDLPYAEPVSKMAEHLNLPSLKRPWHIQACCATNGDGLFEGMQKFADMIKVSKKTRHSR